MEKIKQFHNKLIEKYGSLHLVLFMLCGILCKNFLLQAYVSSSNTFRPDILGAFVEMLPAIIFNAAVLAIFFSFTLLFKGRGRWIYALSINVVFTVIIAIDLIYFRSFNTYPSIKMLGLVQNVTGMEVNPFDWISIFDIFFVLDLIIFPFLAYFYEKNKSEEKPIFEKYKKFTALILSGAIILGFLPICSLINVFPKAFDTVYRPAYEKNVSLYFTAPGFHIIDIADAIFGSDEKDELKPEEIDQINAFYAWNDENLPDNEYAGIIKDKNVILIQMESIEAFVLGQSINGQEITPNLNRILEKSISFTNIYEQTKSGNSSDCDFMMMTSLLPIKKLNLFSSFADSDVGFNSSAKILKSSGYYTSYYNAIAAALWNYEGFIGRMAFDNVAFDFKRDKLINIYIPDDYLLEQVCDKITANENMRENPYFAHVILGTSHMPYHLPDEYKYLNTEGELEGTTVADYLNAAHYVDKAIGTFLEKAENSGILENTVILFTGDHCGIHKYYPSEIENIADTEGYEWLRSCEDATLPFIIYDCDNEAFSGEKIETIGGQIDILPTLLYMLGVDKSHYINTVMGRSLVNTNRNFTVKANGEILGEISEDDRYVIEHMYDTADLIVRSNYYLEYQKKSR